MICLAATVIAILVLAIPSVASDGPWQIASLGNASSRPPGDYGGFTPLVFDGNGIGHIGYYDPGAGRVMYARLVNRAWSTEVVAETGPVFSPSLSLYPEGTPAIAFRAGTPCGDLQYAERRGSAWAMETVEAGDDYRTSGSACSSSLAIDPAGIPHIAYAGGSSPAGLKYATKTGNGWQVSAIDTGNGTGFAAALALDRSGLPVVAYIRKTGHCNTLVVAKAESTGWTTTEIFSDPSTSAENELDLSLALDSRGNPHLGYYDNSRGEIIYISLPGREPAGIERVTPVGRTRLSLALNGHDQPFISYYDPAGRELRWAARGPGSQWALRVVEKMEDGDGEPVPDISPGSSLAFDPYGHPAIIYSSPENNGLKYAAWSAHNKFYLFR